MSNSTDERATPEAIEGLKQSLKEQNDDRKRDALMRRANRAHEWRVQVWAQSEQRIKAINAQLAVMGAAEFEPYEPDFDDPSMIEHYASMTLPK